MRRLPNNLVEPYRLRRDEGMGTTTRDGNNGVFIIPYVGGSTLSCVASTCNGWDHVSVEVVPETLETPKRCPTWPEMQYVKHLFFYDGEVVLQYHGIHKYNTNLRPYVLHLWMQQRVRVAVPPKAMI